ncbi:50S ribosomal protein L6 [Aerococcus sp. UMB10185]|uniref:50S ribosomal protein L6 n=1 Tax=unclassified Aerococcus TaxID=2618060 RepID=UPI0008A28296|nr:MULTISPECIES: 50S ribosomal protein L6 [unclassified Aerococcus]KAB0646354.1 50S ribosomal protein L6 [Aerococcus sanguinicola]MDK6233677.1 50S ribosomal protein L6 [Aerococcus sp. UMB10185]MDK6855968.1 50S ribosomal protein L6 [Aerococcus sp. UMB7533]MDK8502813.1 50S ribosomal protein L6 [Aerococcus sp. UMB1112A]OFN03789.1 50S ribosomal protein L6 [Aerococcus sp. HMSC062A02]
MSRVGNKPVTIPSNVTIDVQDHTLTVKGPKGELTRTFDPQITINVEENEITFERPNNQKNVRALHGTTRALVNNMVQGVSEGFKKTLLLQGVGYRAQAQGNKLTLSVGLSHPAEFDIPEGIEVDLPSNTEINISGADKDLVGQFAANVREIRRPEPYKGKGVRYSDEHIIRKEGKTGK